MAGSATLSGRLAGSNSARATALSVGLAARRARIGACVAVACALASPPASADTGALASPFALRQACGDPPAAGLLVVNGVALPRSAVEDKIKAMRPPEGASEAERARREEAAVAALVEEEVLRQACAAVGVKVAAAEVDAALKAEIQAAGGEARLMAQLARRGFDKALYRLHVLERLRLQRYLEATGELKISEAEVQEHFEQNRSAFIRPEEALAAHILILVPATGTARDWDEALKKIKKVYKMAIARGADFGALAQAHSEDPGAASGGDLGWFRRGVMVQPFEEAAFSAAPGSVTPPFQTQFGWHIVKVYGLKSPVGSFEEARDEVRRLLIESRVMALRGETLQGLIQKARVERR